MSGSARGTWLIVLATSACCQKPQPSSRDAGSVSGGPACAIDGGTLCTTARDCPNTSNYRCDPDTNCCTFFCGAPADCITVNDPCQSSFLGCACDQGSCVAKPCSVAGDCQTSGLVCKNGSCVPPDSPALAAACRIRPGPFALHVGTPQRLHVAFFDDAGASLLVASDAIDWQSTGGAVAVVDGGLVSTTPSTSFADLVLSAAAGGARCSAYVTVYGAVPDGGRRVVVLDRATGLPISDATLGWSDGRTGNWLGAASDGGDGLGEYVLEPMPATGGTLLLDVFDEDYAYLSVVLPDGGLPSDTVVFLEQDAPYVPGAGNVAGGISGDFQRAPGVLDATDGEPPDQAGDVHLGIAGTALPAPPELSQRSLLGPDRTVAINIGGSHQVELPLACELGFGSIYFTCNYVSLELPGGTGRIDLSSETDPARSGWAQSAFALADRPAWALGGGQPFSSIGSAMGVWSNLVPILLGSGLSSSGIAYEAPATLAPPVATTAVPNACTGQLESGSGTQPNPQALDESVALDLTSPTSIDLQVRTPGTPRSAGSCFNGLTVLGGAIEPGTGFLPLGIATGSILDQVGTPASNCEVLDTTGDASGVVTLAMASSHGGLEGDRYAIAVLSESSPNPPVSARAGLLEAFDALPYGSTVDLTAGFLPFVSSAAYDWVERVVTWNSADAADASWVELRFTDDEQRGWRVIAPPGAGSFYLPVPPAPFEDRTYTTDLKPSTAEIDALALRDGQTLADELDFTRANGPLALDLLEEVTAWSALALSPGGGG